MDWCPNPSAFEPGSPEAVREASPTRGSPPYGWALSGLKAKRADLLAKLQEVDDEIALAERWLGKVEMSEPTKPRTLQDAMALVLREHGNTGMRPQRLAQIINERRLYCETRRKPSGGERDPGSGQQLSCAVRAGGRPREGARGSAIGERLERLSFRFGRKTEGSNAGRVRR
jgi:hypothetical protein